MSDTQRERNLNDYVLFAFIASDITYTYIHSLCLRSSVGSLNITVTMNNNTKKKNNVEEEKWNIRTTATTKIACILFKYGVDTDAEKNTQTHTSTYTFIDRENVNFDWYGSFCWLFLFKFWVATVTFCVASCLYIEKICCWCDFSFLINFLFSLLHNFCSNVLLLAWWNLKFSTNEGMEERQKAKEWETRMIELQ